MTSTLLFKAAKTDKKQVGSAMGASTALLLAEYCLQTPEVKLVIAPDNLKAQTLLDELQFFLPKDDKTELLYFPDWETLPYDQFSPHQDLISERLLTLSRLQQTPNALVITSVSTLMHYICPPSYLLKHGVQLKANQRLNIESFRTQLEKAGYICVNKVLEHGEFAIRGAIIDLFPMGSKNPFRLELFDDEIESIRLFDPESQRTIDKIKEINILPAHEYGLDEASITEFRRHFRAFFKGNPSLCPMYETVSEGRSFGGIEYYLSLFFAEKATLFDYLPENTKLFLVGQTQQFAEQFIKEVESRFSQRNFDVTRPLLPPEETFVFPNDLMEKINHYPQLRVYEEMIDKKGESLNLAVSKAPMLPIERQNAKPLLALENYLDQEDAQVLLVVESAGRREVLLELLNKQALKPKTLLSWHAFLESKDPFNICIGPLTQGFVLSDDKKHIITEAELFGEIKVQRKRQTQRLIDPDLIIRDLAELEMGAPVVHIQFGVGRYLGLQYIETAGTKNEFLVLGYANNDKIYVPITSLELITRYLGSDSDAAPLHRLGSEEWAKDRKKAQEKIHDVAVELLEIYAKREAKPGHSYDLEENEYFKFTSLFPFTETDDQIKAINAIVNDLKSTKPMDRLICGDVGFGKTEVAMRAAFIAAQNGRQVCVLVPTTLLAGQHFETFKDRFADFPLKIELLSRFRSAKESAEVLEQLKDGRVDIVIGTHKLLQKDVLFKNLGLLIIDEEHRFGVKQKEAIKALRNHVDILSMTATPIPRTLNMAMAGIRDISLIATPPAKRLAVKTFWMTHQDQIIQEAMLREILRGGQVYYLHNDVKTIAQTAEKIEKLVPEAKVQIAHGQMRECELERVMSDFYHHRFNVLVCTTIVETGIDIPTANTIIIDRADKFGLAQLHQLRGRVGRSHHQAYAYLITPDKKLLTKDAAKRLDALVAYEDLGAGFILATHDLEIRGAGEFLGEEQSGNMHAIGFTLFMDMLEKAVDDLKAGKTPELSAPIHQGPDIDLRISAILPDDYIGDIHTRLILYKRIASAKNKEALRELQIEMIDRFGLLPDSAKHLLLMTELKLLAKNLGINKIQASAELAKIEFSETPNINTAKLISLLQTKPQTYKMEGPHKIKYHFEPNQPPTERIQSLMTFTQEIIP